MKAFVAVVVAALLGSTAQSGKPDFSGSWVLDPTRSDQVRSRKIKAPGAEVRVAVSHKADEITISRSAGKKGRSVEERYRLDGSEATNSFGKRAEIKARAKLDGGRLVIEGSRKRRAKKGERDLAFKEEWSLSEDGRSLTVLSSRGLRGRSTRQVFAKN